VLVERGSRKALFIAEESVSKKSVARVLVSRVERGNVVYTDEYKSYCVVNRLGYQRLSVKRGDKVYAVRPIHVNNCESANWHLRAFLFFKRGITSALAGFYAFAASTFLRLYAEIPLSACHWLTEVMCHVA